MIKAHLIFIPLLFSSLALSWQRQLKKITSTFHQFDIAKNTDSTKWELCTNKILFLKNKQLDTIRSKAYLDSITWFLVRHPYTRVEIHLKKDDTFGQEYKHSKTAQLQTQQIAYYIIKAGVNPQRIIDFSITCGPLVITDEQINKPKPKKTNIIYTCIRLLGEDFRDPNEH